MPSLMMNADMGESFGPWVMGLDEQVMPWIDLAKEACGFHASDPHVMRRTVRLAVKKPGAPGRPSRLPGSGGFWPAVTGLLACGGGRPHALQMGALAGICAAEGTRLHYVKPRGALYNDMARAPALFEAAARAVKAFDPSLPLMTMAARDTSREQGIADKVGVTLWYEAFADRAYDKDGRLVSRRELGAVHHEAKIIVDQAVRIARGDPLTASDGSDLILSAQALCVHGDNEEFIAAVRAIREALQALDASA
ncbi:5-oxoprolinase subunit PxpA [Marinobacter lutaoensis]|uniref:5-oxoprolinase subunit PxpA n=1 Tax=Marinobacter lutaoensis TaxID=135739 RepID=UPI001FE7E7FE|nr:5-oxoprolinase subunit PxpA [Marinobacter lutaoensis]